MRDHSNSIKDNTITLDGNEIDNDNNDNKRKSKTRHYIGIVLIFLIAIFYTAYSELSQLLVTNNYNKPFIVNWFNTITFLITFLIEPLLLYIEIKFINKSNQSIKDKFKSKFNTIKLKKLIILSIPISVLFTILNWLWMWGLTLVQVSISMALSQSSSIFCFILGIIILKEKIRILRTISVVLFIAGVIGIAVSTFNSNNDEFPHALKGEILLIIGAALWGLYEVLTAKYLGQSNRTVVSMYMGFTALFTLIWGIPVIAILNRIGFESFDLPDRGVFGLFFLNALLCYSINFLVNLGLSITKSPLYVRSGELMTIPGSLFVDLIFKNISFPLRSIPGYVLIILGFCLSIFVQYREIKKSNSKSNNENIDLNHDQLKDNNNNEI